MNVKIKTEMHGQIISIEFRFSFPTIYHNDMYANGKVPPKIILLYGGISSYRNIEARKVYYPCIPLFRRNPYRADSLMAMGNFDETAL